MYLPLPARTTLLQLSHLPSFELQDLPQHFLPFFRVNSNYVSLSSALTVLLQFLCKFCLLVVVLVFSCCLVGFGFIMNADTIFPVYHALLATILKNGHKKQA